MPLEKYFPAESCLISSADPDVHIGLDCISLYPNPTPGVFTINGALFDYTISILDTVGNVHETITERGASIQIDLSALPAGLYFISIENHANDNLKIEKIIKSE